MNYTDRFLQETANYTMLDVMLADVAIQVQLSPTDYQTAVDHYLAIAEWVDRKDSPLHGLVQEVYTQGGFEIGATVARHASDEEFDIDAMAQIAIRADVDPAAALSLLHDAIRGDAGSRYYDKVERKSRCSTVLYDRMHLDVTPAVRLIGNEKASVIFHHKHDDPEAVGFTLHANPFGFARWFKSMTPPDAAFGEFFEKRSLDYDRRRLMMEKKADAKPVPAQLPAYRKSRAVIALQLIKRMRNLAYDRRYKGLRMPPSVLLAYYVARHANRTGTMADEVIHQVESMAAALEVAERAGRTVCEFNPACEFRKDELTDRWPADLHEQRIFIEELREAGAKLHELRRGVPLPSMQKILEALFGEKPAQAIIEKQISQRTRDRDSGLALHIPRTGSIPALGAASVPAAARATPSNTFFGD